jgi:hypothetical protein
VVLKEIMAENFLDLAEIQGEKISNKIKSKKYTSRHIIIQFFKTKNSNNKN